MGHERIKLNDSTMDIMVKMSEGNPGAFNALMQILTEGARIDPDSFMGGVGAILLLDTFGIYGTDIYILHSDLCGRNVSKTLAVLWATQLGLFSSKVLADACSRQDYSGRELVPVEDLCAKVKERLPNFILE